MVHHLFASPVEAHQPIFASKQPVIFSHVPSLSLSMQLDGMEFGRRREGEGGSWRNGNKGLYGGWRRRNDRPSDPLEKTGIMAITKIVKPAQEM
jgi:hypothetical protein